MDLSRGTIDTMKEVLQVDVGTDEKTCRDRAAQWEQRVRDRAAQWEQRFETELFSGNSGVRDRAVQWKQRIRDTAIRWENSGFETESCSL